MAALLFPFIFCGGILVAMALERPAVALGLALGVTAGWMLMP
jgi:hypothetical protein